ncbi:MAG: hypothetical protein A2355_06320 [Spirochaetes bacterium RIFOXYB1_FULL_32_8]|nr:MAG: hypothetical protein A2355_06320 [Spirochaetes bacterium RIFOXYB1_FULL_32_8]
MAKKSFSIESIKRGRDLSEKAKSFNSQPETISAIEDLHEKPTKENINKAIELIKKDTFIEKNNKDLLIDELRGNYVNLFNFDNCPEKYEDLKKEAKFLAGMTQYSFILMAQRLQAIQVGELYKKDGYPDFKAFIEKELEISRPTVYRYIDILSFFGVSALRHEDIDYSKLQPIIPVLKRALISEAEKANIRSEFIEKAKTESFRDMMKDAKNLKIKYGLEKVIPKDDRNIKR